MENYKSIIFGVLMAVLVLTGLITFYSGGFLSLITSVFHVIPFIIGFSGGGMFLIVCYYLVVGFVITLLFKAVYDKYIKYNKKD